MPENREPEKGPLEKEKRLPTDQSWDLHVSFRGWKCNQINQSNSHQQNLPTSVGQNHLQHKNVTLVTSFVLNSRRASRKKTPPSAPPNNVVQQKGDHGLLFHYATTL